jgi:hypothetical protein
VDPHLPLELPLSSVSRADSSGGGGGNGWRGRATGGGRR